MQQQPLVAILCCTYNGAAFLHEQLASFARQTHSHWQLVVSDDGSTDETFAILADFSARHPGRVVVLENDGPKGFAHNFLRLTGRAETSADYFAYADQDDVWYDDHLARAIAALQGHSEPALYGARTDYIDTQGRTIGQSKRFTRPPSFANALVQCIAGGNSMVFNTATRTLVQAITLPMQLCSHDWFLYQLVTGVGGAVIYDPIPALAYRQHGSNVAGGNRGLKASWHRVKRLWQGDFKAWNDINISTLMALCDQLTPTNRALLQAFSTARTLPAPARVRALRKTGIYRQTWLGNRGLWLAAWQGKI